MWNYEMSTSLRFQAQALKKVNKSLNKKYISTLAVKHIVHSELCEAVNAVSEYFGNSKPNVHH